MTSLPEYNVALGTTQGGQQIQISHKWYQAFATLFRSVTGSYSGSEGTMPGNFTANPGADSRHSNTEVKTWLAIEDADVDGLHAVATSGSYDDLEGTITITEQASSVIEYPDDKDYVIGLAMKFAGTVVEITAKSTSGTCTLTPKINGTAVTGGAVSVSSTEATSTATAANTFVVGDDLSLTISSNSACENLAYSIKMTRAIP